MKVWPMVVSSLFFTAPILIIAFVFIFIVVYVSCKKSKKYKIIVMLDGKMYKGYESFEEKLDGIYVDGVKQ